MKAFLAIKFSEDLNKKLLTEEIISALKKASINIICIVRDYEKYGEVNITPKELMVLTFREIDNSDLLIVELSEKGVGLGIETGYAFAKNKQIYVIAKEGSDISTTIKGIANKVLFYQNPNELTEKFKNIK